MDTSTKQSLVHFELQSKTKTIPLKNFEKYERWSLMSTLIVPDIHFENRVPYFETKFQLKYSTFFFTNSCRKKFLHIWPTYVQDDPASSLIMNNITDQVGL